MKKYFFLLILTVLLSALTFANQAEFLNSLSEKKIATFMDGLKSFCYINDIEPSDDIEFNIASIKAIIPFLPKKYAPEKALTISDFSLFAVQYLRIKNSLFYLATKSGRYASRELIEIGILPFNSSEFEIISGLELIRLLQKVADYEESKKTK